MKVVLFCGGLGTRIREYSEAVPKPMIPIGHEPVLWHVMQYYRQYGHRDFVLCMGDDTTDEDMFKALEGEAYTIKVNNGASSAQYTILSQQQVLPLLNLLTLPSSLSKKEYAGS